MTTTITKVVLDGFKSFRRETSVPFFSGLTAVIGENGSGKSNLFDAISFVMGRRSSQLRAGRLEQLIFNGGERYKPSENARVVLHLDNQDGVFDRFLDNGDTAPEITIGRRITRRSSTYTFMDKACPRSLLDEVLQEAKIDPDGQQLIAQGSITDVIRRSPQRRREILDEVSGIASYDEKRRKAIVELKDVKSKLNTHRVILADRRRRLLALSRERDAALEYQRVTDEQVKLEQSIRHRQRERLEEKLRRAQEELAGMAERIKAQEEEVTKLDLAIENKEWELDGIREEMGTDDHITLVREVEQLRAEILQKQGEVNYKHQQIKNLQEMIEEVARIRAAESASGRTSARRNQAVEALLERKSSGIYGTIASLSAPKAGYEVAFETAAGGHLNDLVVDSRETAIDCINYLKKNRLGRARILPLRRLMAPRKSLASAEALKLSGVIGYAINLVEFDSKYRRAFEYVFSDTIVAEKLEAIRDVDGVQAVTLDGDIQSKGGAVSGGWRQTEKSANPSKGSDSSFDATQKRQQISKLNKEIERLQTDLERLHATLEEKETELATQRDREDRAKGESSTRSDEVHAFREQRRVAYQALENLRRALTRYEREEAEAQAELEALGKPERGPSEVIEGSVAELEQRIEQNRRRLRRLEPINMRAIDEYEAYEREYDQFRERVDALESEKHEIELLIGQIEDRKRAQFIETLEGVQVQFDQIFRELFLGGSATLELEEPGNISSGLLIKAKPPEKEPHLIDSLSGGEQTLVATAFIFALQEHQRAPFFVLDEIDAALDLTNAARLSEMLRDYAQRIQVIVVSHNEETVRHADRAYGVTMKHGVSQVLALNLN